MRSETQYLGAHIIERVIHFKLMCWNSSEDMHRITIMPLQLGMRHSLLLRFGNSH